MKTLISKIITMKSLGPVTETVRQGDAYATAYLLIEIGEVQRSGAKVYFRPANRDFTCDQETFFSTYAEAYRSEDWG